MEPRYTVMQRPTPSPLVEGNKYRTVWARAGETLPGPETGAWQETDEDQNVGDLSRPRTARTRHPIPRTGKPCTWGRALRLSVV